MIRSLMIYFELLLLYSKATSSAFYQNYLHCVEYYISLVLICLDIIYISVCIAILIIIQVSFFYCIIIFLLWFSYIFIVVPGIYWLIIR